MNYSKGSEVFSGKTKVAYECLLDDVVDRELLIFKSKNAITKDDDPSMTERFGTKGACATNTNTRVMTLLKEVGIPTSFVEQISGTEYVVEKCEMIPLEVICRRFLDGSYSLRYTNTPKSVNGVPPRAESLVNEFFLKTTGPEVDPSFGLSVDEFPVEDPFLHHLGDDEFEILWPKRDMTIRNSLSGLSDGSELTRKEFERDSKRGSFIDSVITMSSIMGVVDSDLMWGGVDSAPLYFKMMEDLNKRAFLVIEAAFNDLGYRLMDWKIEFGFNMNGDLLISDVIDNDSWRLKTCDWVDISKQSFRDGNSLVEVKEKYQKVSAITNYFCLPESVLIR